MALQGDQRALLQLLCERGQSYDDISGLLGISADEVHDRARAALGELGGADPDAEVGLTDYLLGQADPIGRADAVRYLQGDPEALELARRIEASLTEIAPAASLPRLPEPRGKRRRAATPGPGEASEPTPTRSGARPSDGERAESSGATSSRSGLDSRQARLLAALAAAGVILLFVILAVAGVFSSSDDPPATTSVSNGTTTTTPPDAGGITTVELKPTGGSSVAGTARFGVVNGQQLYVDLDLQGLDPAAAQDTAYFTWLMIGDVGGFPINNPGNSPIVPDENGSYSGRIAVPVPVAVTVGGKATSVRVSSSSIPEIGAAAKKAAKKNEPILPFTGTELASGDIPLADASGASSGG